MLPSSIKPSVIYGLLGVSLALNLVMVLDRGGSSEEPAAADAPIPDEATPTDAPDLPVAPVEPPTATSTPPATGTSTATSGDWRLVSADLSQSISHTFSAVDGENGDALSQTFARLMVWDVNMRKDLQRGDRVEVAYRPVTAAEMDIGVAKLHSQKLGKTVAAYKWQAPGDAFASYWHEDGLEIPYRLKNGPLHDYEQITSLLKDRPTHKGMDFKTPTGTPVTSPKSGVVTRVNWNWGSNGNCLEVRYDDGVMAKFLHLSENQVAAGDHVTAGQQLALTGNTGHSTAPHLHYELARGEQVLDPIDYHGAERRQLTPEALASFQQERARLDAQLAQTVAAR